MHKLQNITLEEFEKEMLTAIRCFRLSMLAAGVEEPVTGPEWWSTFRTWMEPGTESELEYWGEWGTVICSLR